MDFDSFTLWQVVAKILSLLSGIRKAKAHMHSPAAQTGRTERGNPPERWAHRGNANPHVRKKTNSLTISDRCAVSTLKGVSACLQAATKTALLKVDKDWSALAHLLILFPLSLTFFWCLALFHCQVHNFGVPTLSFVCFSTAKISVISPCFSICISMCMWALVLFSLFNLSSSALILALVVLVRLDTTSGEPTNAD